jgi:NitT/TauT family transport system permease protein
MIIWELVYKTTVDYLGIWKAYYFPSPVDVYKSLIELFSDNTMLIAIGASMQRLIIGFVISLVLGISIGLLVVSSKYLDENLSAMILSLQTLPSICWLPFALLWFGPSESTIIFVIAIGSTFAITLATLGGIKNVNPLYIRAAKTLGAKGLKGYWNVVIPAALPALITGMKQGWAFAWRGLMAGEMLSATKGLGQVLMVGRDWGGISQVVAVMLIIIALGLTVDKLIFSRIEINIRHKWGLDRT